LLQAAPSKLVMQLVAAVAAAQLAFSGTEPFKDARSLASAGWHIHMTTLLLIQQQPV